jgi:hypothetical protein
LSPPDYGGQPRAARRRAEQVAVFIDNVDTRCVVRALDFRNCGSTTNRLHCAGKHSFHVHRIARLLGQRCVTFINQWTSQGSVLF